MNKMNSLHTEGKNSSERVAAQPMLWGTVVLSGLLILISIYFLTVLFRLPQTTVTYIATAVFIMIFIVSVVSIVLAFRKRQILSLQLIFLTTNFLGIMASGLFVGRTLSASLSILLISAMILWWVMPAGLRRRYTVIAAGAFILMWAIEWMSPPWRIEFAAATVGPAAAVIFALILAGMLIYQTRHRIASSLRYKLVAAFIALTIAAIGIVAFVTNRVVVREVTREAGVSLAALADSTSLSIAEALEANIDQITQLSLNKLVQDTAEEANRINPSSPSELNALDQQWQQASDSDPMVKNVTENEVAGELKEYLSRFPNYIEVVVTDKNGATLSATSRQENYYLAEEDWWRAAWNGGKGSIYISPGPELDEFDNNSEIIIAIPMPAHEGNEIVGVIFATINVGEFNQDLTAAQFGESGAADLVFANNKVVGPELVIEDPEPGTFDIAQSAYKTYVQGEFENVPSLVSVYPVSMGDEHPDKTIENLGWFVLVYENQAEAFQPATTATRTALLASLFVLIGAVLTASYLGYQFSNPLVKLTNVADRFGQGDLSTQAVISSTDEVGSLAKSFNLMSEQLRNIFGTLEQRIAARTSNLELAAKVGRAVSQVRALDVMLKDACDLILKEFNLYYVQVYLADSSASILKLEAGTGSVGAQLLGRGHSLPLNTGSINGRAATEKRSVLISDTNQSTTFRPNALLPETRGEMAVPLIVADNVVGVLDMQSSQPGVLTDEVLPAFEALAGQLAVAIQNANLLAETEQARAQVELQARRLVRTGWSEHLDAIHKPEHLGFMFEHNKVSPLMDSDESVLVDDGKHLTAPISVTGEKLGTLVVEIADENRTEQTTELINAVARQVAQQIENIRLLESAERYRSQAEETTRRATIEGWKRYIASRPDTSLGYMYNLKEVVPAGNQIDSSENTIALPLKAGQETIGSLSVMGVEPNNSEALGLANAVVERLGAHIENLRLLEETRRGQVELDKRARELASVAEISSVSARELNIQKMLETVVFLTQRKFELYHCHVFTFNEQTGNLSIVACGWKEGDEHEGTHGTSVIPIDQEQSLVARSARERRAVVVNDVRSDPGWLPNPLLPDTQSEMALPLLVGDQLLGVLDVQRAILDGFTEEDVAVKTTLAAQIATALQNAYSFSQAQQQAEREAMLNTISQKIQSATTVEAVLQIAARELGHALGAPLTVAQLGVKGGNGNGNN